MKLPRGLRNNNPLNIKIGNDWVGERENSDGVFEEFRTIEYGYRAAFILLRRYINHYKRDTIRKIVDSWAPDGRRFQDAYMHSVSKWTAIDIDFKIDFSDKSIMCAIVQGMARVENGMDVDIKPIQAGYDMATIGCKGNPV